MAPWSGTSSPYRSAATGSTAIQVNMNSRTDGAASDVNLWYKDQLGAEFVRYKPDDPLCCPSSSMSVQYQIAQGANGPVVNPVQQ